MPLLSERGVALYLFAVVSSIMVATISMAQGHIAIDIGYIMSIHNGRAVSTRVLCVALALCNTVGHFIGGELSIQG